MREGRKDREREKQREKKDSVLHSSEKGCDTEEKKSGRNKMRGLRERSPRRVEKMKMIHSTKWKNAGFVVVSVHHEKAAAATQGKSTFRFKTLEERKRPSRKLSPRHEERGETATETTAEAEYGKIEVRETLDSIEYTYTCMYVLVSVILDDRRKSFDVR